MEITAGLERLIVAEQKIMEDPKLINNQIEITTYLRDSLLNSITNAFNRVILEHRIESYVCKSADVEAVKYMQQQVSKLDSDVLDGLVREIRILEKGIEAKVKKDQTDIGMQCLILCFIAMGTRWLKEMMQTIFTEIVGMQHAYQKEVDEEATRFENMFAKNLGFK